MGEKTDNVVPIGNGLVGKNGKPLHGAAGRKLTPEQIEQLQAARRAKAEETGDHHAGFGGRRRRPRISDVTEDALKKLEPRALQVIEEMLYDEDVKIRRDGAFRLLAYTKGQPTQRVETDHVERIEYVLAEHEPAPVASGE
jgi:hypothetical protein